MNKKLVLVIVTASILLGGCGAKVATTSVVKKSKPNQQMYQLQPQLQW